jgi:hypothetical protein
MRDVEERNKRVQISVGTGERFGQDKEAAYLYARDVVEHLEGVLGPPMDPHAPPISPWS